MKKLLFKILPVCLFSLIGAEPTQAYEFYVGVAMGYDRLVAKRTEEILTTYDTRLFFSKNKTQTTNGLSGKLLAGFLWNIHNSAFAIGPEAYFGHGSGQMTLQTAQHDPADNADKNYQSTFKHSLTMGLVLRAGFYLNTTNDFLYVLTGINYSKFENTFMLSSVAPPPIAPVPTLVEKRSKFLKSPVFGIGFEKKFNRIKVGIDCRYTPYSAWGNYSRKAQVSDDTISIRFKPKIISTSLTFCYIF